MGIAYLIGSLRLPMGTIEAPRSGLFPFLVSLLIIAVSSTLLLRPGRAGDPKAAEAFPKGVDLRRVIWVAATLMLYAACLRPFGYLICTTGLMGGVLHFLGMKGRFKIVAGAVLTGLLSYALFVYALDVPLPRGEILP